MTQAGRAGLLPPNYNRFCEFGMWNRNFVLVAAVAAGFGLLACGSSPPSAPLAPTPIPVQLPNACSYGLAVTSVEVPAAGGSLTVTVTATVGCEWIAVSSDSFLVVSTASGIGTGNVTVTASANTGTARHGRLTIAGKAIDVTQADGTVPKICKYSLNAPVLDAGVIGEGGTATVEVTTTDGCPWTAESASSWMVVTSGAVGNGPGSVTLNIGANPSTASQRNGSLTIAGYTFSVAQAAAPLHCQQSVRFSGLVPVISAAGAHVQVFVDSPFGCLWTASSSVVWITGLGGLTHNSSASLLATIAVNGIGAPVRTGSITVAGQTFAVSQAADPRPCTASVYPDGLEHRGFPISGGTARFTVITPDACGWTVETTDGWIVPFVRSGLGEVRDQLITIAANPSDGPARRGRITIAGQTFEVAQFGATPLCLGFGVIWFQITEAVPPAAGTVRFAVTGEAGCSWTATADKPWIEVTAGATGTGDGFVTVAVPANPSSSPARSGLVAIAGRTFTISQASGSTWVNVAPGGSG